MLYTKFVWTMPLSREEDFLRNTSILHFLPKNYLALGVGVHEIYNFLSPYSTDATYQIWLSLPSSSWEEDVNGRRTTHDARRTTTDANP